MGVEQLGTAEIADLGWIFPFEVLLGWTAVAPSVDLLVVFGSACDLAVFARTGLVALECLVAPSAFVGPVSLVVQ